MSQNPKGRCHKTFCSDTMWQNVLRGCQGLLKHVPGEDYTSIKRKRRLEIISIILAALVVIVYVYYSVLEKKARRARCSGDLKIYMVNLTGSIQLANGDLKDADDVVYNQWARWKADDGTIWGCPCLLRPCINKCCKEGLTIKEEGPGNCSDESRPFNQSDLKVHSVKDSMDDINAIKVDVEHFYVIKGEFSCGQYQMFNLRDTSKDVYLLRDGRVFRNTKTKHFRKNTEFCVEPDTTRSYNQYRMCKGPKGSFLKKVVWWGHGGGMLLSVPFLMMVLLTYCLVPQLFNLYGKELVCHITALIIAYTCLGFMKISPFTLSPMYCTLIGHIVQVTVLSSFFWLSIICYDIWWAFSGLLPKVGSQDHANKVKFLLYSLYGWGGPLLILALTMIREYGMGTTNNNQAHGRCLFEDDDARILYLYLPLGVLVFINTSLFIITALRLKFHADSVNKKGKDREDNTQHAADSKADKKWFVLIVKLSVVMGLNWILEIVPVFVFPHSPIWVVADIANALVGVVMFYLFVCKRRILRALNQRLFPRVLLVQPPQSNAITSARSSPKVHSVRYRRHSDLGPTPSLADCASSNTSVRPVTVAIFRSEQNENI